jgi:hypothetical protein
MAKIINYERLTEIIQKVELLYSVEGVDLDEQKLVMEILRDRREQALNKIRASDMAMSMPFGGLLKKLGGLKNDNPEEKY